MTKHIPTVSAVSPDTGVVVQIQIRSATSSETPLSPAHHRHSRILAQSTNSGTDRPLNSAPTSPGTL
jgi:hypothetical protein